MSEWKTILVQCYTVYCPRTGCEQFSDFDEALERAEELRKQYPITAVEISALLDA